MNIGKLKLRSRVIAAPMAGLSLPAFRKLIMELGCGLAYSEMVSADGIIYANSKTHQYYDNSIGAHPFGVQLFTSNPSSLHKAIKKIDNESIDLFDINMGCPVKKIVNNGSGSAVMKTPRLGALLIEAAKKATKKPITVKLRAGWDEKSVNCVEMARVAEQSGADAVILHPRTRSQEFRGAARWELTGKVKQAVSIPVIGNGDIKSINDAHRMMSETGCDAVMVGRAAYRNPWIFNGAAAPSSEAKRAFLLRYIDLLSKDHDEHSVLCTIRTFLSYFARGHKNVSNFLRRAHSAPSITDLRGFIEDFSFSPALQ